MNEAFELGVGVMDIFKDIPDNYGETAKEKTRIFLRKEKA